ncbi:MAG: right-handed parallel beta-helix repeat-containing protein [Deltaproteobacteria bacterium]|nr:right-handed parallel beta-helix repeat-containing protein [Deltaproteobacteria bacterium]
MLRIALVALLLTGCELIADIPQGKLVADAAGGGGGDGGDDGPPGSECTVNPECPPDRPTCDHGTCRGCAEDVDCDSGACLPDGACAAASRIIYAAPGGTGNACSQAQMCSLDTAVASLAAGRDVVKLATGTYEQGNAFLPAADMILLGGDSTIHASASTALIMFQLSQPVSTTLYRVHIQPEAGIGVQCGAGKLTSIRTRYTKALVGIISGTCETVIDRTTIRENTSYGLLFNNSVARVTNTFIVDNGVGDAGVIVFNMNGASTFEHNTIANNRASGGAISGIRCQDSAAFVMRNNIVFGNTINPACVFANSIVDPGYQGGTDNLRADPQFLAVGSDYHIAPTSPAAGLADPASTLDHDFDGEPRPRPAGSRRDVGADEI